MLLCLRSLNEVILSSRVRVEKLTVAELLMHSLSVVEPTGLQESDCSLVYVYLKTHRNFRSQVAMAPEIFMLLLRFLSMSF
jgi:hypothetical protein